MEPNPRTRRRRAGEIVVAAVALVSVVVGGPLLTLAVADHRRTASTDLASADFERAAADLTASVHARLQRNADLLAAAATFLEVSPTVTNDQFQAFFDGAVATRYPGLRTLGFVERVPAARLGEVAARLDADRPSLTPGPFALLPAGDRPEYCLPVLGARGRALERFAGPNGLDLCAIEASRVHLRAAQASGLTQLLTSGERSTLDLPMRDADVEVATSESSRQAARTTRLEGFTIQLFVPIGAGDDLRGWLVGSFDGPSIISELLRGRQNVALRLDWLDPGGDEVVVAEQVLGISGPAMGHTEVVGADGRWQVTLRTSAAAAQRAAEDAARATVLLGALITALVALVLATVASSRNRALRMVDAKTRELHHLAMHDPLTHLPNRAQAATRAATLLADRRAGGATAALFIDLDGFKAVNDTFGHAVGDELLQVVAERLRAAVRGQDTVARFGGDEFVVVADAGSLPHGPEHLARRIIDLLAEPILVTGADVPLQVGASVGIASGPYDSTDDLLRDADAALYRAKAAGRGCYVTFDAAAPVTNP